MNTKTKLTQENLTSFVSDNLRLSRTKRNIVYDLRSGAIFRIHDVLSFVNKSLMYILDYEYTTLDFFMGFLIREIKRANKIDIDLIDEKNLSFKFFYENIKHNEQMPFFQIHEKYCKEVLPISNREFLETFRFWIYEHDYEFHHTGNYGLLFVWMPNYKEDKTNSEIDNGSHYSKEYVFFSQIELGERVNCRDIYLKYFENVSKISHKRFFLKLREYCKENNVIHVFSGKGEHKTVILTNKAIIQ